MAAANILCRVQQFPPHRDDVPERHPKDFEEKEAQSSQLRTRLDLF
jgi:hypothetical protein